MHERYRIDAGQSRFTVQAFAEGLFSFFGHNPTIAIRGFGGDVRLVPGTKANASVLVLVQARSLAVTGKISEKDAREIERMIQTEVLETESYPEIVFTSTGVTAKQTGASQYQATILGDLSLHGVTRDERIDAQLTLSEGSLRARGEFSLRQSDYKITRVSVAGGTLKVKDEVQLSFDIVGEKAVNREP
jgi:polyisoprenoid-binding protein YceI